MCDVKCAAQRAPKCIMGALVRICSNRGGFFVLHCLFAVASRTYAKYTSPVCHQ